jgi:fucose permease
MTGRRRAGVGLVTIALAAFVMLGLVDGSLGVAWPSMRAAFGRGIADLGLLLACGSVGYLSASTGYGAVHARVGTGRALVTGAALLTVGVVGVAAAPAWVVLAGSAVVLGLGGGLVDAGMNAHAALEFDVRSINLAHACFGVGATLGPLLITVSLTNSESWRAGYAVLAATQALTLMMIWRWRGKWKSSDDTAAKDTPGIGGLLLLLALFLLYTGVEVAAGQWAFTLLSESRGMATATAGAWVAAYWGGLTAGRLVLGLIGDRIPVTKLIDASLAMALLGIGFLWWDPFELGAVGLPVAGLGFAAVFPTLVSLTPARIGRYRSTRTMGYQLAAANIGAAAIPWLLGVIAEARGLASLAPSLFAATFLLAILNLVTGRAWRSANG